MKKQDLQNFDIVELRNGNAYMVNANNGLIFGKSGWMPISDYEENLTNAATYFDFVRVRRPEQEYQYGPLDWGDAPIIWERKEMPELSHVEKIILGALNKPEWWIARDDCGLWVYGDKPVFKDNVGWCDKEAVRITLFDHLFDFIEKDKDCYRVKDLIGDGGE